jgi:hypothetical protein
MLYGDREQLTDRSVVLFPALLSNGNVEQKWRQHDLFVRRKSTQ